MLGFVFGVLIGFGAKMAYDFFQEERIPTDLGMSQGRAEAIMDETRQIVREIRDELRSAATATQESVARKVERLQGAATGGDAAPAGEPTEPASGRAGNGPAAPGRSTGPSPSVANAPAAAGAPAAGNSPSTGGADASPTTTRTQAAGPTDSGSTARKTAAAGTGPRASDADSSGPGYGGTSEASEADDASEGAGEGGTREETSERSGAGGPGRTSTQPGPSK